MRRREFLVALGGGAAISFAGRSNAVAQPSIIRRLGVVTIYGEHTPEGQQNLAALRASLNEYGWVEGRNLRVEYRFGAGDPDRAQAIALELVAISPDVILAHGTPATTALRKATNTIPIIFTLVADPVGAGIVESLSRPGANVTGFSTFEPEIGGKWLQLLRELRPELRRVAGIVDPLFLAYVRLWRQQRNQRVIWASTPLRSISTSSLMTWSQRLVHLQVSRTGRLSYCRLQSTTFRVNGYLRSQRIIAFQQFTHSSILPQAGD